MPPSPISLDAHIEICGGIASGKTTLALLLHEKGLKAVCENFQANPFWAKFYQNPTRYSFETELTFFLQHYSEIKTACSQGASFVCDFCLRQDLAYARTNLSQDHFKIFQDLYFASTAEIPPPNLIVQLRCRTGEQMRRIRRRARPEEHALTETYLSRLNAELELMIESVHLDIPTISLDSELVDFANDAQTRGEISAQILQSLRARS